MKKLLLSVMAVASLAFATNAVTYMNVKTDDGSLVKYDVEKVTMVDYEEATETPSQVVDGVTVSGKVGIYTYVDLGLESGTKWATCNVGASKPTESGDYFAWGETKPKAECSWSSYKWCNVSNVSMTKYCTDSNYGTVDDKKVLDAEDDAATANWGSAWRMPTKEEQDELREGCDWKWVEDFCGSGVNGQLGTSKKNGATIFLPAAGYRYETDLYNVGKRGYYWSSSLEFPDRAYDLDFKVGYIDWSNFNYRVNGQGVRAVLR